MFDLLMLISLIPYFAGFYAHRNLYFWTWYEGELEEALVVMILFWLISFFPVLDECLSEDGILMKIVLVLSTLINGCVFIQHVGPWALARIITEDGFQIIPFLKIIGPLVLIAVYFIYESLPKKSKNIKYKYSDVWEDQIFVRLEMICWGIGIFLGTCVIICLFNSMPETIIVGGLSLGVIPGFMGYKINTFGSGSEAWAKMLSEGFVQPTWSNIPDWTLRLKIVAVISLVFLILSFTVVIIRSVMEGEFFDKVLTLCTGTIAYVYFVYAFLIARREILMHCFLWNLAGESMFAFAQSMIIFIPFAFIFSTNNRNGVEQNSGGSMSDALESYNATNRDYDIASLPNRIFYNDTAYYYQSGVHPRIYRSYEGDEILIYHCTIHGDSAQTNIGQIMLR